jgi:hypothetical protein
MAEQDLSTTIVQEKISGYLRCAAAPPPFVICGTLSTLHKELNLLDTLTVHERIPICSRIIG